METDDRDERIIQLSCSLRSLLVTLETVDDDERELARKEGRRPHLHTRALRDAYTTLNNHAVIVPVDGHYRSLT